MSILSKKDSIAAVINKIETCNYDNLFFWGDEPQATELLHLWKKLGGPDVQKIAQEALLKRLDELDSDQLYFSEKNAVIIASETDEQGKFQLLFDRCHKLRVFPLFSRISDLKLAAQIKRLTPILVRRCRADGVRSVAVYGGGSHTRMLLAAWRQEQGPEVRLVLQTNRSDEDLFQDLPLQGIETFKPESVDAIILSSKTYEHEMARICHERWPHLPCYPLWNLDFQSQAFALPHFISAIIQRCEQSGIRSIVMAGELERIEMALPVWLKMKGPQVYALYSKTITASGKVQGVPLFTSWDMIASEADALLELSAGHSTGWFNSKLQAAPFMDLYSVPGSILVSPDMDFYSWEKNRRSLLKKQSEKSTGIELADWQRESAIIWSDRKKEPIEQNDFCKISVLLFCQGFSEDILTESVLSVLGQSCQAWDLVFLVSNDLAEKQAQLVAKRICTQIKVSFVKVDTANPGKVMADALSASEGDFLLFLSEKDALFKEAFNQAWHAIKDNPDVEAILSRELSKPEAEIEILNAKNTISMNDASLSFRQFTLLRRSLLFRKAAQKEEMNPFGLAASLIKQIDDLKFIAEIPGPLYFWRPLPGCQSLQLQIIRAQVELKTLGLPLTVTVDARIMHRKMSGSERYMSELLRAMAGMAKEMNVNLQALVWEIPELPVSGVKYIDRDYMQSISSAAVFHRTYQVYNKKFLYEMTSAKNLVLTFFDLISYTYRDYFKHDAEFDNFRRCTHAAMEIADHVLAISEHNRREIIRTLSLPENKVSTVHLAPPHGLYASIKKNRLNTFLKSYNLVQGYLLYVGTDYPHKNLLRLLRCYANSRDKIGKRLLLIVGNRCYVGHQPELEKLLQDLRQSVVHIGHLPEKWLPELYSCAHALIYPSLYEGFGLPPLEAMSCGLPVAASRSTSIPEVVGDAALLFDGLDDESVTKALIRICNDDELRSELMQKGRDRLNQFSWEKTARETIRAYYHTYWNSFALDKKTRQEKRNNTVKSFSDSKPLVLLVTHVPVVNPAAGNELRLVKLIRYLRQAGYRVALLYSPLDDRLLNESEIQDLLKQIDYFHQVSGPDRVPSYIDPNSASAFVDRSQESILIGLAELENRFCPPGTINAADKMIKELQPDIVLAQYIWMSRVLKIVPSGVLKVVDLIDKFSDKKDKVVSYGIPDILAISEEEEEAFMNRADLALAIQDVERERFQKLNLRPLTITVGIDFELKGILPTDTLALKNSILVVASDNDLNVFSIKKFIEEVWIKRQKDFSGIRLRIIGKGGMKLKIEAPGVDTLGYVEDLHEEYRQALFVINPVIAGTGLKIKSIEALAHGKALISTPAGVEGLPGEREDLYLSAGNSDEFYSGMQKLLNDSHFRETLERNAIAFVKSFLTPDKVYAELSGAFSVYFKGRRQ